MLWVTISQIEECTGIKTRRVHIPSHLKSYRRQKLSEIYWIYRKIKWFIGSLLQHLSLRTLNSSRNLFRVARLAIIPFFYHNVYNPSFQSFFDVYYICVSFLVRCLMSKPSICVLILMFYMCVCSSTLGFGSPTQRRCGSLLRLLKTTKKESLSCTSNSKMNRWAVSPVSCLNFTVFRITGESHRSWISAAACVSYSAQLCACVFMFLY